MKNLMLTLLLISLPLVACKGSGGHGHDHGEEADHGGHDHPAGPERPDVAVTVYEDGLELFMEYPALVVGLDSPLVAHFTDVRDPEAFRIVTEGQVTATLRYEDGTQQTFEALELLRAGIFKPIVKPGRAGKATLTLRLDGEQVNGTVHAGELVVYPSVQAAADAAPQEDPAAEPAVGYLKETQWRTQFATAVAEPRALQAGVPANAQLKPVAGQEAHVSAPVAGRVVITGAVPHVGLRVRKGTLFGTVSPITGGAGTSRALIELEVTRARAGLDLAERDLRRVEGLFEQQAVPEKRVDEARSARDLAAASLLAAQKQLALLDSSQSGVASGASTFQLRAPLDGVVSFADLTPGAVVDAGARLLTVVNTERVWLEARVFESDIAQVENATGAAFFVAGFDREFVIDQSNGRRVAVGAVIDDRTRTVPVIFEVANPRGLLKPGMFAKATLFTGRDVQALAIPEQAVVDDNGTPTVYVMEGGESFFKRRVRLGVRSNGYVEVLEGVKPGERVVSRGAYEIKLATAAGGIPEHGHQH